MSVSPTDEGNDLFANLAEEDPERQAALRARLAADAADDGILDVAYRTMDSPVGELLLACTREGLVRVAFEVQGHDYVLDQLAEHISARVLKAPSRLDQAAREIDEYFQGRRTAFNLAFDLRLATGLRRTVLSRLLDIAYGSTASYAAVAAAAGHPRAARAVGTACATNPIPIVVPCHRVVRSDGKIGQYGGGSPAKATLLGLEAGAATGYP